MVLLFMANLTELSCLDSFRNTQTKKLDAKKRIMKNIYNNNQVYTKNSSTSEILRNRTVFIFYNNLL